MINNDLLKGYYYLNKACFNYYSLYSTLIATVAIVKFGVYDFVFSYLI